MGCPLSFLCYLIDVIRFRWLLQAKDPLNRIPYSEVTNRQDVQPPEGEDQKHMYSPDTYPLDTGQGLDDFLICHSADSRKLDLS